MKPVHVYRGNYIESMHDVHIAVTDAGGGLLAYYGDPHRLMFARSSMKPFQAVPAVKSGAVEAHGINDKELALFTASHSGEPFHRKGVGNIMEKIGLREEKLQCGTHIPKDMESYRELIRTGGELTPYYSNCSGKHAGMLTGVVHQDLEVDTYRDLAHPYQQQVLDVIADIADYDREKIATAVDGCGVPVHRLPLDHVATAFGRLAKSKEWKDENHGHQQALNQLADAMASYPEMVAGTKRYDTDLMKAFNGRIVAKGGAEGVHCFGDRETGIGVAIKTDDGNARATNATSVEVMHQLGIMDDYTSQLLRNYHHAPILNARDEAIGGIKTSFSLLHL